MWRSVVNWDVIFLRVLSKEAAFVSLLIKGVCVSRVHPSGTQSLRKAERRGSRVMTIAIEVQRK